jgi:hypothetical protein
VQQNPNPQQPIQINADFVIDSLKHQRNEAFDGLALIHARYAEAAQMNANLVALLNDEEALTKHLAELIKRNEAPPPTEADEADEAEAPKPKRVKKAA